MLTRIRGRIIHKPLDRVSPSGRVRHAGDRPRAGLSARSADEILAEAEAELLRRRLGVSRRSRPAAMDWQRRMGQTALRRIDDLRPRSPSAAVLDLSGAMYLPDHDVLLVADLHFEKGSSFARRGQFLPPYDTRETLAPLARTRSSASRPRAVIALGDSFHDSAGPTASAATSEPRWPASQAGRSWIWVTGNHDRTLPPHDRRRGGRRAGTRRRSPCATSRSRAPAARDRRAIFIRSARW